MISTAEKQTALNVLWFCLRQLPDATEQDALIDAVCKTITGEMPKETEEEMETKHSPGPWVVDYDDGRPVGITAPNEMSIPGAVGGIVRRNGIGFPSSEAARANARLIAAAPELLEAIEVALIYLEDGAPKTAADRLRAAIAKATGGE